MTDNFDAAARDLLTAAVPPAPSADRWAAKVRHRRGRGQLTAGLLGLALLLAIPAGAYYVTRDSQPPAGVGDVPLVSPGSEVWGNAMIYQDGEEPMICFFSQDSYPPQCSGPALKGDFSWEDLAHEEASGVRWTNDWYRLQGTFDPGDGPQGSLTLTAALAEPEHDEELGSADFPQLCEDPLRGADTALTGDDAQAGIESVLQRFEVVDVWVSNGVDAYNVIVRGDAEEVHTALREVWGGELCVESAPGGSATEAERVEVVEKIFEALASPPMLGGGPSGPDGGIELNVLYLDREAYENIREVAGGIPVTVVTSLTPLRASGSVVIN